ncbi:carbohydrate kinase [Bacillus sp. AFS073361]|uniref:carbohydrate kinase family protein n=1 Tax=Bacillus sp. AFS073361 TaxID=2033511 RepID=UPI000BF8825B|nr:carbohydrate kinase [Bacillus sp. AFS073361]PFP15654.1 carbohydrate kinase [Bacillus sp. AFS073361]
MKKIISLGEALIDFIPTENGFSLTKVDMFKKNPGGAPANVAVAVAKLGGNSYFAGKVGDDSFGHFLNDCLKDYQVNTDYLLFTKEAKTALAFVSLNETGERDFQFYGSPSADMIFSAEEVDDSWFTGDEIFHFCSNSLSYPVSRQATEKGMEVAKQKGAFISFDPNIRFPFWTNDEDIRATILPLLPSVDFLKISEEELSFLFKEDNEPKSVEKLLNLGISLIVVTKGSQGCSYYTRSISNDLSAPVVKTIDTTGAGDAFVGGLLYQLALLTTQKENIDEFLRDGETLNHILKFANVCGAITTTARGAMTALPSEESINKFLQLQ